MGTYFQALILIGFYFANGQKPPHIIFTVADDLGWNDVSWHNSNIFTPNLEALAREAVILNQSYVQPVCTPSRVAFMTGYYPYRVGRQNHVLNPLVPAGVPLRFAFLPEKLKEIGYRTHLIGKWHLGFCNISYTPTQRGFDSFFGFYNGALDYFSHTRNSKPRGPNAKWNEADSEIGYDFRNNTKLTRKHNGVYSTMLLAEKAKELISSHPSDEPLFLFLSFQAVHSPLQVPKSYEDLYRHIRDEKRRKYSGMVTAMDDAIGSVVNALKEQDFWKNSIFVFTTDNGGQTLAGGNNWPLRGNKGTLWEGGTRAVTFVSGSQLKKSYVNDKLFHAVDWFPTFLQIAGAKPVPGIDGLSQWNAIKEDREAVRNEIVYNIYDLDSPRAAIRVANYKLIQGFPGKPSDWITPADGSHTKSIHCRLKKNDTLENSEESLRLYDLRKDPLERYNVAKTFPSIVRKLKSRIEEHKILMVPADDPAPDERGEPKLWGNSFSPGWCIAK
ncbi:arylsulfatase B [Trichonephila clavata]|uniref:Arylsulfatase B n=1 Tax=Trichonephila clavata TaxID=2740835 RepID=A0A8X6HT68_TRICU|nr:arylsulfatase B [Trichonephila clavata]